MELFILTLKVLSLLVTGAESKDKLTCDVDEIPESIEKGRLWLLSQRDDQWGWGRETHRAIITLYLTNHSQFSTGNLEDQLMAKELELQLAVALWGPNRSTLTAGQLALYIHGLLGSCHTPRNYFGVDLAEILLHYNFTASNYSFALESLSLCNAGRELSDERIGRLLKILPPKAGAFFWTDTRAMAVMALSCVVKKQHFTNISQNIEEALNSFKKIQNPDGSFGNVYTSGLVVQAFLAAEDNGNDWDFKQALLYLLSQQQKDGSFGDLLATYFVLPALACKSFVDLGFVSCVEPTTSDSGNGEEIQEIRGIDNVGSAEYIKVRYSLWFKDENEMNQSIIVDNIQPNTTFFQIMEKAAEQNPKYKFKWESTAFGPYVVEIAGIANDAVNKKFWMLYVMDPLTIKPVLSKVGVGKLRPKNEDHIIFWYQTVIV
ncbi:uncharacterized protein CG3556-like isoform X2 [Tachypleus tridentatus]|uniref:uncharacterized protein CG3556-like isoform X2 n=1 Tax=Tachypleus tridentatus TaxID=6853 RepID=UPI003FD18D8D